MKEFLNTISKDEQLQASAKKVKFLQDKWQTRTGPHEAIQDSDFSLALLKLRERLPPKAHCDRLVSIYFQFFERTMRVLHGPTFKRQYEELWLNDDPDICSSSSIIVQLTVVMTMAYHMDDAVHETDIEAHVSYLKGEAIDLIQAWLDGLGGKERTELSTLQVEILLLLSRSLRYLHPGKLWSLTGALVRTAMVMGLHMDPTGIAGITPYQTEMRRRLWATVLEIDLQASMTAGMPVVNPELDHHDLVPANLDDADFDDSSTKLPGPRPLNTLTDSLYQVQLAASLPQRLKAFSLSQRPVSNPQEAVELGQEVEECLTRKPSVLSLHHDNEAPRDEGALLHLVLLDLYIRRPILCLYKPLLLADQQDHTPVNEIQKHSLGSSVVILTYQHFYTTQAPGALTGDSLARQDFFYRCCKTDLLWAALTICQHIKLLHHAATSDRSLDRSLERELGHDESSLVRLVESTIQHLIGRIGRKGSDVKDIVFLSLALKWVQLTDSTPRTADILRQDIRGRLAACLQQLLQPLDADKHPSSSYQVRQQQRPHAVPPPAKRIKTSATSLSNFNDQTPPFSNTLTPESSSDLPFPMDLLEDTEQWFGELPDLTAEFTTFQGDMTNGNMNMFNFDAMRDWNGELM